MVEGLKTGETVLARTSLAEKLGDMIHAGPTLDSAKPTEVLVKGNEPGVEAGLAGAAGTLGNTEGTGL